MAHLAFAGHEHTDSGANGPTEMSHGASPRRTRNTPRKRAMLEVLEAAERFLSAAELHDRLSAHLAPQGLRIGLATVYNQLRTMSDSGKLDTLYGDDGEARYWLPRHDAHHHYLVCRSCGGALEVEADPVEEWAARLEATVGFRDVTHNFELFGLCDRCTEDGPRRRRQVPRAGQSSPPSRRPGPASAGPGDR